MSIRTTLSGVASTAALALGLTTAPALANDFPQVGDECTPRDSRERLELPDGSVLECQRPDDGGRDWSWTIVVEPTDEPTTEPTQEPPENPTDEPTRTPPPPGPTEAPTEQPTDEPTEDPVDDWADFVSMLEQAPDGIKPGRFCKDDHALLVYAWNDNSAVQCQYNPDSDRHHWVQVHGFEDLVIEDEDPSAPEDSDEDNGDDKPTPPTDSGQDTSPGEAFDRSLPVTGSALAGLVVAAMTATGAGATALWATRRRSGHDEDGQADSA